MTNKSQKTLGRLYGSAPNKESFIKLLQNFYYSEKEYELLPDGEIKDPTNGQIMKTVRWVKKGTRYRLEGVN